MTSRQIGNIPFTDNTFGLGFEVVTEKGSKLSGQSVGSFGWGGFFGSTYWVDPKKKIVAQIYVQQWPFSHGEIAGRFKAIIYNQTAKN